jgi:hypothetical protein
MIFKNLKLKNFKSFYGTHEFNFFGSEEGLYFITGENLDDKQLGANGSGKSSLINSIYWCLYGKDLRGLKAGNVHSLGAKGSTEVELTLEILNKPYKILRSWQPNKLLLTEGKNDSIVKTQEELEEFIGLSESEFQNTVIFGQFGTSFLDLTPSQMLETFTNVLGLEYWTTKSDASKEERNKKEKELIEIEHKTSYLQGQLKSIKEYIETELHNIEWFEEDRINKLEKEKDNLIEYNKQLDDCVVTIKPTNELELELEKLELDIEEVNKLKQEVLTELTTNNIQIRNYDNEISGLNRKLNEFLNEPTKCPTCGQSIDKKHTDKEVNEIKYGISCCRDIKKSLNDNVIELDKNKKELENELFQLTLDFKEIKNDINSINTQNLESQSKKVFVQSQIKSTKSKIETLRTSKNPYIEQKFKLSEKEKVLENEMNSIILKNEDLIKLKNIYDGWVKGFKEIRLMVIEQAISEFEVEVNNSLIELGLENWTIKFDVEKENKTGGISKGFNVLINRPNINEQISWLSYSGGESQRLKLAVQTGLTNLILSKKGFSPNMEIYDEQSKHMNSSGIQDLAEFLASRAKNLHKQIWLVDHNVIDYGGFSDKLVIIKHDRISNLGNL